MCLYDLVWNPVRVEQQRQPWTTWQYAWWRSQTASGSWKGTLSPRALQGKMQRSMLQTLTAHERIRKLQWSWSRPVRLVGCRKGGEIIPRDLPISSLRPGSNEGPSPAAVLEFSIGVDREYSTSFQTPRPSPQASLHRKRITLVDVMSVTCRG